MSIDIGPSAIHFAPPSPVRHIAYFDPADDAVPNPGMGICCYGASDHMYVSAADPHDVRPLDRATFEQMVALPHCDHIYLRIEWRDIQKEPGKLSLLPVWEWTLEAAETYGKSWSFRIMPICPHSRFPRSTPEFLDTKLQFVPYHNHQQEYPGPSVKYFPVYDEVYLRAWQELLHLLAERFDQHPLLEFVDISGYGKWGEWHHWPETDYEGAHHAPVVRRLVDDHLQAFRSTPAVMLLTPSTQHWKDEVIFYVLQQGCGLRRDSFYPLFTTWEYQLVSTHRQPGTPFVYESGLHPDQVQTETGIESMTYARIYQRLLDIGASYVGLGFNPWHALITHDEYPALLQKITARIGYRLRPAIVWLKRTTAHERKWLSVGLINDGVAPPSGTLTLRARFDSGPELAVTLPPGLPAPGPMELVELELPPAFDAYGHGNMFTLSLTLTLGGKERPVRWAVPSSAATADRYQLRLSVPNAID